MNNETNSGIDLIKSLFEKVLAIKYVYAACIFLFVVLAYFYNKYSTRVYELDTTIGPLKDTRAAVLASGDMSRSYSSSSAKIEDAINSLYSFELISKTLSNLNFGIGYFVDSTYLFKRKIELYPNSPFTVRIDKSHIQTIGNKYRISILSDSTYRLSIVKPFLLSRKESFLYNYLDNIVLSEYELTDLDTICKFNSTVEGDVFKFSLFKNPIYFEEALETNKDYYFEFYHPDELTKDYMKKLSIAPISYMAAIIKIKFSSENIQKSLSFLNSYVNVFLDDNLAKKNKIALSTINFINSQISDMSDSLVESESKLRNFKSNNQVMDISYQGQQLYKQIEQLEARRNDLETQSRYYNFLVNVLKTNDELSQITVPSGSEISDPIVIKLISDLVDLINERSLIQNPSDRNPFISQLDNRIRIKKQSIIETVTSNLNSISLNLNELNYQIEKLYSNISNIPRQEMNMVNIQREYDLNSSSYTYLLQKRSEAQITLASTYPDYEILEPAREITSKVLKPKTNIDYIIALFLGLFFPSLFVVGRMFLSDKISSAKDVEQIINRSVFGSILNSPKKYEAVVAVSPDSAIAESFRNLRNSIFLKYSSNDPKVILFTSSQPQDGKSFVSFNLAASIASVGHSVIIIDCDLRRPTLHKKFSIDNSSGISQYLIKLASEEEIIHKTSIENLASISAGPILPNASELVSSGGVDALINYLKSKYEYIIIDTPPIGLVADSIVLMRYATQTLIVVRNNYTRKHILADALSSLHSNGLDNYDLIINDISIEKSNYSNYRKYYGKEKV